MVTGPTGGGGGAPAAAAPTTNAKLKKKRHILKIQRYQFCMIYAAA